MLRPVLQALFSSETRASTPLPGTTKPARRWPSKHGGAGKNCRPDSSTSSTSCPLDASIPEDKLLGRVVTLSTTLSDGSKFKRSGGVRSVIKLGSDGGFGRYRVTVVPWIWLTTRNRHNRVFKEKSVIEIIDAVFSEFSQVAALVRRSRPVHGRHP